MQTMKYKLFFFKYCNKERNKNNYFLNVEAQKTLTKMSSLRKNLINK